jgi:hypothetical protein
VHADGHRGKNRAKIQRLAAEVRIANGERNVTRRAAGRSESVAAAKPDGIFVMSEGKLVTKTTPERADLK